MATAWLVALTMFSASPSDETADFDPALPATANEDHVAFIPPWWVLAQGQFGVGLGPVDPSGSASVNAGRWLGKRRHVRAAVSFGWEHARRDTLHVHGLRPGVQVDFGAALCEKTWLGAGIGVGAVGAWSLATAADTQWAGSVHVPVVFDAVLAGPLIFRASAGVDLQSSTLRFRRESVTLNWGFVRPFVAAGLGLRFG